MVDNHLGGWGAEPKPNQPGCRGNKQTIPLHHVQALVQLRQNWGILAACKKDHVEPLLRCDDAFKELLMSNNETSTMADGVLNFPSHARKQVNFDRKELGLILNLYGRFVAEGEWRDYAIDFGQEIASFSVFRRASEQPLYKITKNPNLARKQGLYAVVAQGGLIMKRGNELEQVLRVLIKKPKLADA